MGGIIEYGRLGGIFAPYRRNHVLNRKPVLLLHCDGEDEGTTITDSGATGHTVTANDDTQLDTSYKKFGSASILFDGTTN